MSTPLDLRQIVVELPVRLRVADIPHQMPLHLARLEVLPTSVVEALDAALNSGYGFSLRAAWQYHGRHMVVVDQIARHLRPDAPLPLSAAEHPAFHRVHELADQDFDPTAVLRMAADRIVPVDYRLAIAPGVGAELVVSAAGHDRPRQVRLTSALATALVALARDDATWTSRPRRIRLCADPSTRGFAPAPARWTPAHDALAEHWAITAPMVLLWSGWLSAALAASAFWPFRADPAAVTSSAPRVLATAGVV